MKLEILSLRILFVVLNVALFAGGFYFLSEVPTATDNGNTVLVAIVTLASAVIGTVFGIVKGVFKPVEA